MRDAVRFPPGYYATWSGQFEYMERAKARLMIVVPVTVLIIFLLLYLNFRRVTETLIVMLSVPFALAGGLWLMWWLGFNMSVAAAVGFIALAVGGLGSNLGAIIGGAALGILTAMASYFFGGEYQQTIAVGLLMCVLLLKPEGLLGAKYVRPV